jgi:hypothetical protein
MTRPRAADNFATIRARMVELRRELERAEAAETELQGDPPTRRTWTKPRSGSNDRMTAVVIGHNRRRGRVPWMGRGPNWRPTDRRSGLARGTRAAAIAAAAGIPISTHLYPEVAAHVMRVSETAHWLEWQDWANPILQEPYKVKDGKLHIPDVPGVGLEWDEKVVAEYLADNF